MTLEAFQPPERLTVEEWAERSIILRERESDFAGRYRTSIAPYCRGVMNRFQDRMVREIVFVTPTQAGKTINVIFVPMLYTIDQDPGGILFIMPTEPLGRSYSETRLQPIIDDSPALARHKPKDDDKYKLLEMHFDRSTLNIIGSNSPANLGGRPIRYIFGDEIDKYPPASTREADALSLVRSRIKAKYNAKIVLTSTPTTPEGNIWREWMRSDQAHLMIICPHCGHPQKPIMGAQQEYETFKKITRPLVTGGKAEANYRLRWPKDCAISDLDTRGWYQCENSPDCIGKLYDKQMREAVSAAEWQSTRDSHGVAGFHLNELCLPWVRLGEMAANFLRSKRYPDQLQDFYNSSLALPWDAAEHGQETIRLESALRNNRKEDPMGYLVNTCPDGVLFLTGGIDVQEHEIWYVIRGWGRDDRSWLISFGSVPVETDDIAAFVNVVNTVVSYAYGKPLILSGIDSGWGKRTAEVYLIVRALSRLVCTKGRRSNITKASDGKDVPVPPPKRIDKMPDGKALKKGPLLYSPSTSYWKRWLFARIAARPRAWFWPTGIETSRDGQIYISHLESEREVTKRNPQTGRSDRLWIVRRKKQNDEGEASGEGEASEDDYEQGYMANHLLDCEIIAAVAYEIAMTATGGERLTMEQVAELVEKVKAEGVESPQKQAAPRTPRKSQTLDL